MAERHFILRDTTDPEGDLRRGFSGNVNAWFDTRQQAVAHAETHGSLTSPKQCPVSSKWCGDPELGLSGFVFADAAGLDAAMERIAQYVEWRKDAKLSVFASNAVQLGVGLDGEDVFTDGWLVAQLPYPFSWSDLEAAIPTSISQDLEIAKARAARVLEIVEQTVQQWIDDPEQPDVQSGWCITQGPCGEFAAEVFEKITEEFPGIDIAIETSDQFAEDMCYEFGGYHEYLRVEDLYYDSHEQAMPSPEHLPFIRDEIRYAELNQEEDDEEEEAMFVL